MKPQRIIKYLQSTKLQSFIAFGASAGAGMVFFILLSIKLPLEQLAGWIIYTSVFALLDSLRSGILESSFIFYMQDKTKNQKQYQWFTYILGLFISIIIGLFCFLLTTLNARFIFFPNIYQQVLVEMVWLIPISFTTTFIGWRYRGKSQFLKMITWPLSNYVLLGIGLFIFYTETINDITLLYQINLYAYLLLNIIGLCYLTPKIYTLFPNFRSIKKWGSQLLQFGKWSSGGLISDKLNRESDYWFTLKHLSTTEISTLGIHIRVLEISLITLRSFIAAIYPKLSQYHHLKAYSSFTTLQKSSSKQLLIITCILIPSSLLTSNIWFQYTDLATDIYVSLIFITIIPLTALESINSIICEAKKYPSANFIKSQIGLILNVTGTYLITLTPVTLVQIMSITLLAQTVKSLYITFMARRLQ